MADSNSEWAPPTGPADVSMVAGAEAPADTPVPTDTQVPADAEAPSAGAAVATEEVVSAEPAPVTEAVSWTGWKIDGLGSSSVGRIEGVITDIESREPAWLLVRMGRFGHFSAIPYALAAPGSGRIWVPFERDALRSAPRVDAGSPLTREVELELCAYYGIPEDQGRAAQITSRASGSATAQLQPAG